MKMEARDILLTLSFAQDTIMIWLLRKLILLFSSETSSRQLAAGIAFGLALGLIPVDSLFFWFFLLLALILRVNLSLTIGFMAIGKLLWLPLGSILLYIGATVLNAEFPRGFFTALNNTPVLAVSGFDRPSVMGGVLFGVFVGVAVFPLSVYMINKYRAKILPRLEKLWIVKVFKGSVLYRFYSWLANP